ncbi:ras-related protein Rab-3D-like [Lethenteron reissneri]|uniref:ras-related protein Rab-3D-like n=1 Tax=Lethenteron reissneri TaxID=7753 RepID=UPI002AB7CF1D|nr:ras-related protein Rab-3D-like [Lethenteron reissneri]
MASATDPKQQVRGGGGGGGGGGAGELIAVGEAGGGAGGVEQPFDLMFKLLIIGNSGVGKTSLLFRYAEDSFTAAFVSTVGIDFKVKTLRRGGKTIKLQIWDTAGQERYRTITTAYYRGAMGFLLVYDITSQESFTAITDWATQITAYSWDSARVIVVGNKCDLEPERVVATDTGKRLAEQLGFGFRETSSKENLGVAETFDALVDLVCERLPSASSDNAGRGDAPVILAGGAHAQQACSC